MQTPAAMAPTPTWFNPGKTYRAYSAKLDRGGGNTRRSDKDGFLQKQKRYQGAPGTRVECLPEVDLGATVSRRTQLRVNHSIAD
jgi:hypothetical protein